MIARALLALVLVAPWLLGGAPDSARYGLVSVACAAIGLHWLLQKDADIFKTSIGLVGVGVIVAVQVGLGAAASFSKSLEALLVVIACVGLFGVDWGQAIGDNWATRLASAVVATASLQALFGIVQWATNPRALYGQVDPGMTLPFGSYVNHNHFAGLQEMAALLAIGWLIGRVRSGSNPAASVVLFGASLLLVLGLLASQSRGGLVGIMSGGAFGAYWLGRVRRPATVIAASAFVSVVLVTAGLWVAPAARSRVSGLLEQPLDGSGSYRIDVARGSLRMFAARPVAGWGLGNFEDAFPAFKRGHGDVRTTHAESDILEFTAETGLVGLAVALGLGAWWLGRFRKRIECATSSEQRYLTIGAGAAVVALVAHGCFDFNLRLPANAFVFASLAGLAAAPVGGRHSMPTRGSRVGVALASLFLLTGLLSAWRCVGAVELARARLSQDAETQLERLSNTLGRHPYLTEGLLLRSRSWVDLASRGSALREARLAQAEDDLTRAVALRPQWGRAIAERAWVRWALGDHRRSGTDFKLAASLDPTNPAIAIAHARFLREYRGSDEAVAELDRLAAADPGWKGRSRVAEELRRTGGQTGPSGH